MPADDEPLTEQQAHDLRLWHIHCVAAADAAKARGDRKEWHGWSRAAAEVLVKLADFPSSKS